MPNHLVKTHADGAVLPREEQLAWKIAQMAAANTHLTVAGWNAVTVVDSMG